MHLCEKAGVPTDRYLGLNDIEPLESLLDVSINVVSNRVGNTVLRVDREKPRLYFYIVKSENEKHWHGIASIQGFTSILSLGEHRCYKKRLSVNENINKIFIFYDFESSIRRRECVKEMSVFEL